VIRLTYPASAQARQESDANAPAWKLHRGATLTPTGTRFSVWAPNATSLTVHVATGSAEGEYPLSLADGQRGVWEAFVAGVTAGHRYGYRIDGGNPLPDPVSRSQPEGVHALSEVVDPDAYTWMDEYWRGVALADCVIYEIHVGTFTPEGTFDAAAARLPELRALGITALELMPVASFPGRRNWGYDGVHLYAPQETYGGAQSLKRLVNSAHAHGIGVVLDVVYNHVGPEGNYLDRFGPYFTDVHRTAWGQALNYGGPGSDEVRRWALDNALYWVSEFHVDALRLDAVHAIFDVGALSFLEELSDEVHELGRQLGRKVQLMAESDLNDPRLLRSPERGGLGLDAQWADDVHHTMHAMLTGEHNGYYQDFRGIATMADVYREPFFNTRRYSAYRDRVHGTSPAGVPRQRFIVYSQNHDQVGNRPNGERLASLVGPDRQRLAAALILLSPYVPLLFMGEEYGETAPFLYFIDHADPALIESVRVGRQRELTALGQLEAQADPQKEETFQCSRLDWERRDGDAGSLLLALYRDLLALRREEPAFKPGACDLDVQGTAEWLTVLRVLPLEHDIYDAVRLRRAVFCAFNLSDQTMNVPVRAAGIGAMTLRFSTDAAGYGGAGAAIPDIAPDEPPVAVNDAPKRLIEAPAPAKQIRSVRLPAWSAAVFVRDVADYGDGQ
jgi:maltooligosyltrehalose trehalohydrolase